VTAPSRVRGSNPLSSAASNDLIAHLGTLDFVTAKENVFVGPPGTGKTHCETPGVDAHPMSATGAGRSFVRG